MSEESLIRTTLRRLRALPGCWAVKQHQSRWQRGEPDIHGCLRGRAFFLEAKTLGKRPTHLQAARLRRWRRAGAIAGWFTTADEALALVQGDDHAA